MNLPSSIFAVCLLVSSVAQARDTTQEKQSLLRAEAELCKAFEAGDVATLRRVLDPTFTLTDSRGTVTNLVQNLTEVEKREPFYDEFRNHGQDIRFYGDAAVVTGITSIRGRSGGDAFQADFQFTDTWIRRDGKWLLVASHASKLPDKK